MEKERANFVYGNPEEGVPGCVANGIPENVASKIYDEMMDFAKYAFNKSHAACYAVVAYQTAFLKYYYPVEFMAALMTSVIDNSEKVAEYIEQHEVCNFRELLLGQATKMQVIIAFLIILEMMKEGVITIVQEESFGEIHIAKNKTDESGS